MVPENTRILDALDYRISRMYVIPLPSPGLIGYNAHNREPRIKGLRVRIMSDASGKFPTTGVFSLGGVELSHLLKSPTSVSHISGLILLYLKLRAWTCQTAS